MTDIDNNCLHILDQNGQFLRCVDDCGLERPYGLSVDSEGRLWVGLLDSGEIKVIKYGAVIEAFKIFHERVIPVLLKVVRRIVHLFLVAYICVFACTINKL